MRFLLDTLQRVVGGYVRGQLIMCSLIGVLVGAGMYVIGVPFALLLGVLAFLLEFIPVLGTLTSGAICVLLALTRGWLIALIVLAYFVVVHIIEGDVLGPRIIGKTIGLHPVVSMTALIAGSRTFWHTRRSAGLARCRSATGIPDCHLDRMARNRTPENSKRRRRQPLKGRAISPKICPKTRKRQSCCRNGCCQNCSSMIC